MSASDHLHPGQLAMFMTARELHDTHSIDVMRTSESRYGGHWKSMDAMWATKRKENKDDGLDKHIAEHGVHAPVQIAHGDPDFGGEPRLINGHHRVIAAFDHNPDSYVPVDHEDFGQKRTPVSAKVEDDRGMRLNSAPGWEPINRFPSMP